MSIEGTKKTLRMVKAPSHVSSIAKNASNENKTVAAMPAAIIVRDIVVLNQNHTNNTGKWIKYDALVAGHTKPKYVSKKIMGTNMYFRFHNAIARRNGPKAFVAQMLK